MISRLSRRFSCIMLLRLLLLHTVRMTWRLFPCFLTRGISREYLCEQYCVQCTTQDLRQLFESYGAVDTVNIITDRDTGQSWGLGSSRCLTALAKAAIQGAQGKELAGRALTVDEARPREPRREPSRALLVSNSSVHED